MSESPILAALAAFAAGLLAFYGLVLSLAQVPGFRHSPRRRLHLHLLGWAVTLLLLGVFATWRVSLRGQWLDDLPFGLAWLAAGAYCWRQWPRLGWLARLYFGGWLGYPALLALAYLADKIFFVLLALPIVAFLPATTYYSSPDLTLRAPVSGFLGSARVGLLEPVAGIWERHEGLAYADQNVFSAPILSARRLASPHSDSAAVLLRTGQGNQVVKFGR